MTESEYVMSGCDNFHSEFVFKGDNKVTGVMTSFFPDQPHSYQLVITINLKEFHQYMEVDDYENMKKLCRPINLEDIISVKRI